VGDTAGFWSSASAAKEKQNKKEKKSPKEANASPTVTRAFSVSVLPPLHNTAPFHPIPFTGGTIHAPISTPSSLTSHIINNTNAEVLFLSVLSLQLENNHQQQLPRSTGMSKVRCGRVTRTMLFFCFLLMCANAIEAGANTQSPGMPHRTATEGARARAVSMGMEVPVSTTSVDGDGGGPMTRTHRLRSSILDFNRGCPIVRTPPSSSPIFFK
jgi:hypothetical protein